MIKNPSSKTLISNSFYCLPSICASIEIEAKMMNWLFMRSRFDTKCRSLIERTRDKIKLEKNKAKARQSFLSSDISALLARGLEKNAYEKAVVMISEKILSWFYDSIDGYCVIIWKRLPTMQIRSYCPKDCREAVASLMFAAARFSDFPDLRELRDKFQERYGNSVENYVNKEFLKNWSPRPHSMEEKVQVMQECASRFSVSWDYRGFEERLSNSNTNEQDKTTSDALGSVPSSGETVQRTVKDKVFHKQRSAVTHDDVSKAPKPDHNSCKPAWCKGSTLQIRGNRDQYAAEFKKIREAIHGLRIGSADGKQKQKLGNHRQDRSTSETYSVEILSPQTHDQQRSASISDKSGEKNHKKSMKKVQGGVTHGLKSKLKDGNPTQDGELEDKKRLINRNKMIIKSLKKYLVDCEEQVVIEEVLVLLSKAFQEPEIKTENSSIRFLGVGFDYRGNDFKFIFEEMEGDGDIIIYDLHSLIKTIERPKIKSNKIIGTSIKQVNNNLHWKLSSADNRDVILRFDLHKESWGVIIPVSGGNIKSIFVREGRLGYSNSTGSWVMEEYGNYHTWKKLSKITPC